MVTPSPTPTSCLVMLGPQGPARVLVVRAVARTCPISTGDILRGGAGGTEMGRAAGEVMDAGRLVGDDI